MGGVVTSGIFATAYRHIARDNEKVHVDTLLDALDKLATVPKRNVDAPMRMPVSGIYKIKGVGDVITGRVEQGVVKPNEEVLFMPTHLPSTPCPGKVFTVEMHHKRIAEAKPGDNVGLNVKNLNKDTLHEWNGNLARKEEEK